MRLHTDFLYLFIYMYIIYTVVSFGMSFFIYLFSTLTEITLHYTADVTHFCDIKRVTLNKQRAAFKVE